jgi:hypothetical protein
VVFLYGGDVSAAQDHFVSAIKMIETGKGANREVKDYALTALGLFAACQQAQLPELDVWFIFAGLQAAGYGSVRAEQPETLTYAPLPEPKVGNTNLTLTELTAILGAVTDPTVEGQLVLRAMTPPPPPPYQGPPPPPPVPPRPYQGPPPGTPSLYTGTPLQDSDYGYPNQ